jgi:putative membrane protein
MNFFIKIVVIAALSFALANILGGVHVDDFLTAVLFAFVLAVLNVFAKPLLILLTLPVTLFTLGLFLFVVNAVIVLMASKLVDGFRIDNFWWALLFSILLSLMMSFIDRQTKKENESR